MGSGDRSIAMGIIAEAFTSRSLSAFQRILLPLQAANFLILESMSCRNRKRCRRQDDIQKLAFFKAVDDSYISEGSRTVS